MFYYFKDLLKIKAMVHLEWFILINVSTSSFVSSFPLQPQVPPCVGHRDKGVGVSRNSTDDTSTRRALSPTEGALPVGTPDAVTPRSSRLSWKSETEDRGKACRLVFYVSQQKLFFVFQYDSRNVITFNNNKKRQIVSRTQQSHQCICIFSTFPILLLKLIPIK